MAGKSLIKRYPPSAPCDCDICLRYCIRPGWWTVDEASRAFHAGYALRMMLEISPNRAFGVLSPAFKGCEGTFALKQFADRGCCFLDNQLCELHGTAYQPLECRFCHHSRAGLGPKCHADIEMDWRTPAGRSLVKRWTRKNGLWKLLGLYGLDHLKE